MSPYKGHSHINSSVSLVYQFSHSQSDCEDMDDASASMSTTNMSVNTNTGMNMNSPPRSIHKASASQYTPSRSRRLFDEDESDVDVDVDVDVDASPPMRTGRLTLKPLDLNHVTRAEAEGSATGAGSLALNINAVPEHPQQGLKRSSRNSSSPNNSNNNSNSNSNNNNHIINFYGNHRSDAQVEQQDSDQTMYTSPHMSPASFRTMDGRFVTSKNPFSSPIMNDAYMAAATSISGTGGGAADGNGTGAPPPTFPLCLDSNMPSILPPRHSHKREQPVPEQTQQTHLTPQQQQQHAPLHSHVTLSHRSTDRATAPSYADQNETAATATATLLNNGGYPNKSYGFTGSPIAEMSGDVDFMETNVNSMNNLNNGNNNMNTDSDAASGGSLQKVRRLSKTDDVFSASEQHFSTRRRHRHHQLQQQSQQQQQQQLYKQQQYRNTRLSIDTSHSSLSSYTDNMDDDDNNNSGLGLDDSHISKNNINKNSKILSGMHDDISPTDVLSFPPPPTPVKTRPSKAPYQPVRRHEPTTPYQERREHGYGNRTPHPAGHGHHRRNSSRDGGNDGDDSDDSQSIIHSHNSKTAANSIPKSRFYSDFDIIGELGKGSFGTVYKVLSRLDGCMYAIKAAQRKAKGQADRDRMLKEVYALAALSDQADTATFHIVRYHQAWMEDDRLYIQTELCTGTLTHQIASQNHCLPEIRRYKLLREIGLALDFIHRYNMVHLDIKPENIFLKNDQFKLGDFGLVAKISYDKDVEEGDSRYMSMELLSDDHTDLTKSDIFSLGATMYEICVGRPLPASGPEWQEMRAGHLLPMPDTSPDLSSIIRQMMHPQAASRPTASDLLKHKQLLSEDQKALMAEMTKVKEANMELEAQAQRFQKLTPPLPKKLQRANTWSGHSLPHF